jgi:hypothetical protein
VLPLHHPRRTPEGPLRPYWDLLAPTGLNVTYPVRAATVPAAMGSLIKKRRKRMRKKKHKKLLKKTRWQRRQQGK